MRMINGKAVPEGLSREELKRMMASSDMQTFSLACEALRDAKTAEAYVLSVIFSFPEAVELTPYLKKALHSDVHFLVDTALTVLMNENVTLSDDDILSCFSRHIHWLDGVYALLLGRVAKNSAHTERVIAWFRSAQTDSMRIALAEQLLSFATEETFERLFGLFSDSPISKVRMAACRLADMFDRQELLARYAEDPDGHIRRFAKRRGAL